MRSLWRVAAGLLAVLLLATLVLFRWEASRPIGSGESTPSPDGRYLATAYDYTASDFWTGKARAWTELGVTGPGIAYHLTSGPIPGPDFGARSGRQVIFWEKDPQAVRFVFPGLVLRIETGEYPPEP